MNTCPTLPRRRSDALCLLDLLDATATEPNGSQCPCALLSMKSCSVRLTSPAVRRDHSLLPAQLMHCYQPVDIPLPLLDNAQFTRLLGCFQHMPLFTIWAAATGTVLCSYLSTLMDLVIIPESTFYVESTPLLAKFLFTSAVPRQDCSPHACRANRNDTWRKQFTYSWITVISWNHDYAIE